MKELEFQAPAQPAFDSDESTLPWQDVIASVFRHRRLVITIFVVGVLATTVWAWMLPPTYRASVLLMVRDNRTRIAVSPDQGTDSTMDHGTLEEINSLVKLLTSSVLVEEILTKNRKGAAPAPPEPQSLWTRIISLPDKLYRKIHSIPEPSRMESAAKGLAEGIVVTPVVKSNVLELAYYSGSPKFSSDFANRLVEEGVAKYTRLYDTTRAKKFYGEQRELLAASVDKAQAALNEFRERVGAEMLTLNRDQVRGRMAAVEQEAAAEQTNLAELHARLNASPESIWSDANSADPSSGIVVNPAVSSLKARLIELEITRGQLISRYAPTSVMIRDIDKQIGEARRLLAQERERTVDIYRKDTQARIDAAEARVGALQKQLADYQQKLAQLDVIGPEWERLFNELDTSRQAYQTYLKKEEEARFTNALDESQILNVTVAEPASPPNAPVASPMVKLIAAGSGLSLILGIALALVRDWMDPSVKTTKQAERLTGIPVLGEIPL